MFYQFLWTFDLHKPRKAQIVIQNTLYLQYRQLSVVEYTEEYIQYPLMNITSGKQVHVLVYNWDDEIYP